MKNFSSINEREGECNHVRVGIQNLRPKGRHSPSVLNQPLLKIVSELLSDGTSQVDHWVPVP